MKKARFQKRQNPVTFMDIDGRTTVTICINEIQSKIDSQYQERSDQFEYIYDFNQWTDLSQNIDKKKIQENPQDYTDTTSAIQLTDKQKIEKALANSQYAIILAGGQV